MLAFHFIFGHPFWTMEFWMEKHEWMKCNCFLAQKSALQQQNLDLLVEHRQQSLLYYARQFSLIFSILFCVCEMIFGLQYARHIIWNGFFFCRDICRFCEKIFLHLRFVGADLEALTKEAANICINRIFCELLETDENETLEARQTVSNNLRNTREPLSDEQLQPLSIDVGDLFEALKKVQPSAKREG